MSALPRPHLGQSGNREPNRAPEPDRQKQRHDERDTMIAAPGASLAIASRGTPSGEIAQNDRWEKQRSGRMMALHCRSPAGAVHSSLGKRVPQTRNWG